jgi:outer membrane biogenesis lipoprotein LolB
MNHQVKNALTSLFVCAALAGCVSTQNKTVVQDDPYFAPVVDEN